MADVSKIKLPSGTTYNIKDTVSGYTKNTGTITSVETTAGAHTAINVSSGAVAFNVPTKTSHLTNDSGFLTSHLVGNGAIDVSNNQISLKLNTKPVVSIAKSVVSGISGLVLVLDDGSTDGESLFIPDGDGFYTGSQTIINQIPTKTSDLTNDGDGTSAFATMADIGSLGGGTITQVQTTAGAHTAINVTSGVVSFNVPTTAAHVGAATSSHAHGNITNGGDITATAPTVASGDQIVINDHSASKITNGPTFDGSTITKALTPKGTWETFASSDKQLEITALTDSDSGISYYPIMGRGNTAAIRQYDEAGFCYIPQEGTTANDGYATLSLGNNITSGTIGNRQGRLRLFDSTNYCGTLSTTSNHLTDIRHWYLPDKSGLIALVSDIREAISYPVTSVNGETGAINLSASDVGAVPTTRTVNNKALSSDISLTAADVSAVPTTRTVNNKVLSSDITLSASDVGAQATLVSGSNIKTINDISLLGSGDVWEALFNIVHPIYSFFETTDATFDPNTATGWYGTWELETEGLVHIGAGSTYTIGNTGGNKDAIIPYHKHTLTNPTVTVPKHTHGFTQPKVTGGAVNDGITGGSHEHKIRTHSNAGSGSSYPFEVTSAASKYVDNGDRITAATHTHDLPSHTHTVSGGAVSEKAAFDATVSGGSIGYAGTSGNLTNANMQPYVVVNRWYRTA